jgi:N-methylhydantoinase B
VPLVQHRRELRADSGGAGAFRGGLGQATEFSYQGSGPWSVSAMIDRTKHAAQGAAGGRPGAPGEFLADGEQHLQPKTVIWFAPDTWVQLNLPGGGGYGDPFARDPQRVLDDVVNGYISLEAAEREYGVAVRCTSAPDQLVRLPGHYTIDWDVTEQRRRKAV